jgi:hypothetical protein
VAIVGSNGLNAGDPEQAKRFVFTSYMSSLGKHFATVGDHGELEVFVPAAYRFMRVLLADAIEEDEEVQRELQAIDNDQTFRHQAEERRTKTTQNPRKIARRERLYAKMEVLERLAVRRGIWGHEDIEPDETATEVLDNPELDDRYDEDTLDELGLDEADLEAVDP